MLQIGDNVEVIDELISGAITKITPQEVSIRMENGIIITFPKKKVVKVDKNTPIEYHKFTNSSLKEEKKTKKNVSTGKKSKKKRTPVLEIDLHIEKLVANTHGMTNFDILNRQIEVAKFQLELAMERKFSQIIFIHGVGEGILRAELEVLFSRYKGITYQDANYALYGAGATEVFLDSFY